jgi:putative membrane protein
MFDRSILTRRAVCGVALVALLGSSRASFGSTPRPDPERAFLADAAAIGRAMVETGRLAAHRGGAPEIRAVGHTVSEDWSAWLRDLERLAADRVVTLPTSLDIDRQSTLERLQAVTGEAFDAAYLEALAPLHEVAEQLFEAASRSSDAGIQGFAEHALPQLRADRRSTGRLAIAADEAREARASNRGSSRRIATGLARRPSAAFAQPIADRRPPGGR